MLFFTHVWPSGRLSIWMDLVSGMRGTSPNNPQIRRRNKSKTGANKIV